MPLPAADDALVIRAATRADLEAVLAMLAEDAIPPMPDDLGPPLPPRYVRAFERIDADPGELLAVADLAGEPVGAMQLSFIPQLARQGSPVAQLTFLRVASRARRRGIGERMVRWAAETARLRGCHRLQLETNKERADAHRLYRRLGFEASHEALRLRLD